MDSMEIMSAGRQDGDLMINGDVNYVVAQAEKRVSILKKVLGVAVKRTSAYDWVDQNGKPYLTASGAEKLLPVFGISIEATSSKKTMCEDEAGTYYIYEARGTFSWAGGKIEAIGSCSSRDRFFAYSKGQLKAMKDVDECNIMKAAYSNLMVRGITQLLGIRNLSWEQLAEFGIKPENAQKVEYKAAKPEATGDEKKRQDELRDMILQICNNDKSIARTYLESITKFKNKEGKDVAGVSSCDVLTGKRLEITISKVKEEYKEFKEGAA